MSTVLRPGRSGGSRGSKGRAPWLVRGLVAVVVLGLLVLGAWALWFSDLLAARQVQVSGTSYLLPAQVRAKAAVPTGRPLVRVNLQAIRARVSAMPAVAQARVSRSWPHTVRIEVRERHAVAVVSKGAGFDALAADGVIFRHYRHRPPRLPQVQDEGANRDALREAATVVGALPRRLLGRIDHVSVKSVDQIQLTLRNGRVVVWGSAARSRQKAEVLGALLHQRATTIDVSVPGRPTTR